MACRRRSASPAGGPWSGQPVHLARTGHRPRARHRRLHRARRLTSDPTEAAVSSVNPRPGSQTGTTGSSPRRHAHAHTASGQLLRSLPSTVPRSPLPGDPWDRWPPRAVPHTCVRSKAAVRQKTPRRRANTGSRTKPEPVQQLLGIDPPETRPCPFGRRRPRVGERPVTHSAGSSRQTSAGTGGGRSVRCFGDDVSSCALSGNRGSP